MHNEILVLADLSNHAHKGTHAYKGLTSGQTFTGGLYGFLIAMSKTIKETGATRLIVGADSKPYQRSKEFPGYKGDRKKKEYTEEDELILRGVRQTESLIRELCNCLGIPVWEVAGFEYDDLVGHTVRKYRCRFASILASTSDSDLYQLFYATNFALHKGKNGLYQRKDFRSEWEGISPKDYIRVLALMGTHNGVPGVDRVGPKTAIKAVQGDTKFAQLFEQHKATVERNLPLIELPHAKFPYREELPPKQTMRDPIRALYKFAGFYDIEVTNAMATAFEQVLT